MEGPEDNYAKPQRYTTRGYDPNSMSQPPLSLPPRHASSFSSSPTFGLFSSSSYAGVFTPPPATNPMHNTSSSLSHLSTSPSMPSPPPSLSSSPSPGQPAMPMKVGKLVNGEFIPGTAPTRCSCECYLLSFRFQRTSITVVITSILTASCVGKQVPFLWKSLLLLFT